MIDDILRSAEQKILFLPHAIQQMSRPDRMISTGDVRESIFDGEVIESYLDDPRGRSYLVLHKPSGRAIHIVCAPKEEYLAIVTAYIPNPGQWDGTFSKRLKS